MEQRDERDVLEGLVLDSMGSLGSFLDQLQLDIWQQLLVQLVQHGCIVQHDSIVVQLEPIVEQLVDDPNDYKLELVGSSEQLVYPNGCMLEHEGQHYHRLGSLGTLIEKLFY